MLVDLTKLEHEYYARRPDLDDPRQLVGFGTSGHRGTPLEGSFNEAHILAIAQAICDYRSHVQPNAQRTFCRWNRRNTFPQPAGGRRLQVQPA